MQYVTGPKFLLLAIACLAFPARVYGQAGRSVDSIETAKGRHVYIDHDRNSRCYSWLPGFRFFSTKENLHFADMEIEDYKAAIAELTRNSKLPLNKFNLKGLPHNWYRLLYYKGGYYTYVSDANEVKRIQINDSTVIDYCMEWPCLGRICSFTSTNNRVYQLQQQMVHSDTTTINIYICDIKNKVAVFEYLQKNGEAYYELMASADKIRSFPAIVNYDPHGRSAAFRGDDEKIPFRQLIGKVMNEAKQ